MIKLETQLKGKLFPQQLGSYFISCTTNNREFKKTTTTTAIGTSPNKRF